jgi:ATP-dependent Clp protease ATP-binding subunit ClpA
MGEKIFDSSFESLLEIASEYSQNDTKANYIETKHLFRAILNNNHKIIEYIQQCSGNVSKIISDIEQESIIKEETGNDQFSFTFEEIIETAEKETKCIGLEKITTELIIVAIMKHKNNEVFRVLSKHKTNSDRLNFLLLKDYYNGQRIVGGKVQFPKGYKEKKTLSNNIKNLKTLNKYGKDITLNAQLGKYTPAYERDSEIQRVLQVLSRKSKNNPVLVGEPGVGKTAIVEGIALEILKSKNSKFKDLNIISLDIGSLIAGTKYRGEFEERLTQIIQEASSLKSVVLFIDEIHMIVGAGGVEGTVDAANILKPALARGDFQLIGATTTKEYKTYIEKDLALERRFHPIKVEEPSLESTTKILIKAKKNYENHHRIKISEREIREIINISNEFIKNRQFPDKAFDILDEAAAVASLEGDKELLEKHIFYTFENIFGVTSDLYNKKTYRLIQNIKHELIEIFDQVALNQIINILKKYNSPFGKRVEPTTLNLSGNSETIEDFSTIISEKLHGKDPIIINAASKLEEATAYNIYNQNYSINKSSLAERIKQSPYRVIVIRNIGFASNQFLDYIVTLIKEGKIKDANDNYFTLSNCLFVFATEYESQHGTKAIGFVNNEHHNNPAHDNNNRLPELIGSMIYLRYSDIYIQKRWNSFIEQINYVITAENLNVKIRKNIKFLSEEDLTQIDIRTYEGRLQEKLDQILLLNDLNGSYEIDLKDKEFIVI